MKNGKPLFTYTTIVEPQKTASEIQSELIAHGAKAILMNYDGNGQIESLSFKVDTPKGELAIKLPCNPKPIFKVLQKQYEEGKIPRKFVDEHQALRIAWRILLYWVKAQMVILETEMVKMEQIFLPYMISNDGQTFYEKMLNNAFQLPGEIKNEVNR